MDIMFHRYSQKGEITTILSIGALVVVGIGVALGLGYGQQRELRSDRAEAGGSCTYKAYVHVYRETEGIYFSTSETGILTVTNDRRQLTTLNSNERSEGQYVSEQFVPDPTRQRNYAENDPATVTLSGFDTSEWAVKEVFCTNRGTRGCPTGDEIIQMNNAISNGSSSGTTINGFRINCGVDVTYGWVLGSKAQPEPTTEPTSEPTVTQAPTEPPVTPGPSVTVPPTTPDPTSPPPTKPPPPTTEPTAPPPSNQPSITVFVNNKNPNVKTLNVTLFPCPDPRSDVCSKAFVFDGQQVTKSVSFLPGVEDERQVMIREITPMSGSLSSILPFIRPVFAQANGKVFVTECIGRKLLDGVEDEKCLIHSNIPPARVVFDILTPSAPNPPIPAPMTLTFSEESSRMVGSCRYMVSGVCSVDTFADAFSSVLGQDVDVLKKVSALCHATTGSVAHEGWKPETARKLYDLQGFKAWETLARRCGYVK